jgi:histidyl-tRNA synthetase
VGGGGRYDGLIEMIKGPPTPSPPTPGMGWAAGVERILLAGEVPPAVASPVDLFVALDGEALEAAFEILTEARSAGLTAQMELAGRPLKGQLGHANALGARYVAIVGGEETVLKDMQGAGQERIATDTVVHAVLRGLRTL